MIRVNYFSHLQMPTQIQKDLPQPHNLPKSPKLPSNFNEKEYPTQVKHSNPNPEKNDPKTLNFQNYVNHILASAYLQSIDACLVIVQGGPQQQVWIGYHTTLHAWSSYQPWKKEDGNWIAKARTSWKNSDLKFTLAALNIVLIHSPHFGKWAWGAWLPPQQMHLNCLGLDSQELCGRGLGIHCEY